MSTQTLIRVISMRDAEQRRARFSSDARDSRVEWGFFDALRKPEGQLKYDADAAKIHTGRPLRNGELGCYASHFNLWVEFLQSASEQLLVLEDDVVVDWAAISLLCRQRLVDHQINILKLYATHPFKTKTVRYKLFSDHSHLVRIFGFSYGTQAYMLSRNGAQALIDSCRDITMPIDWAISRYWEYNITNFAIFPFPIFERFGLSTIEHTTKVSGKNSSMQKLRRLIWRIRERMSRLYSDLQEAKGFAKPASDLNSQLFTER